MSKKIQPLGNDGLELSKKKEIKNFVSETLQKKVVNYAGNKDIVEKVIAKFNNTIKKRPVREIYRVVNTIMHEEDNRKLRKKKY
ncbi:MAG: hypothetical protein ACLFQU_11615 [Candidatus Kapaibacterium sp.]